MLRTLIAVAAIAAAALAAVGLTFSASVDERAELRFVNGTEPRTLDPQLLTGQPGGRVVTALFEGLTRYDSLALRPAPGVARSWEVSPDGRRYVFHLRREARWSDGRPVTAHDFTYAWRRLQDPALGAEYAYILHFVRYAEALHADGERARALAQETLPALLELRDALPVSGERWLEFASQQRLSERTRGSQSSELRRLLTQAGGGLDAGLLRALERELRGEVERRRASHAEAQRRFGVDAGIFAVDDHTLIVELVAPTPYFLELAAFYPAMPVPRWVIEQPGAEQNWFLPENIVTNGPFELKRWRVNDHMRLVRSEWYWGRDEVGLASVDVLPIENTTTALNLYLTGDVDWLPATYPRDLASVLRKRPDFYAGPGLGVYYYRVNTRRPPFDDPRVRRALALSIDRELITSEVSALGELPAHHLVPPGIAGYEPPRSAIRFDPARARRLLAEAGFPAGEGFPEFGILYNTNESHKKIAEVIADGLRRELGLHVRAYNQEWQSYLATIRSGDYDLARAGWIGDYEDPNTFLDLWVTEGGNNQTGWSLALYDRLIAAVGDVEGFAAERGEDRLDWAALDDPDALRALLSELRAEQTAAGRRELAARLRMRLLREAEAVIVQRELPVIPIYFYVMSGLVSPEVGGFTLEATADDGSLVRNLRDQHPLRDLHRRARAAAATP